ncbi:hypothetical protein K504DRAFT_381361 [Pleomassaria siparia CBS 279.74]|uniref:EKC/KEOPS complex subunit GON7 n=1 Tax=Pleomassaria siparia CBS 279.74 TaxID=1314801 RepID=A0A6G1K6K7_9PLEO|nr:hypothetical protein K504DRAFT_381361 [Pleomassaria siparia CBS 279.74]
MFNLTATYTSPESSSPHTISLPLPAVSSTTTTTTTTPPPTTDDRITHLAKLQTSIKSLQADLNAFLTEKMEEDKVVGLAKTGKVDDAKEEENYGEEVVEAD